MIGGMKKDHAILKIRARQLRKRGFSYNEIRKQVYVSKSTLSLWLKTVSLKPEHQRRLYTKQIQILSRGPQSQKERRAREIKKIIQEAESEIELPISFSTLKLFGTALYWAEGSKGKMCEITNSDPRFILFIVRWIEMVFGIPPKNLKARLNIYSQQSDTKIKKFWSDLTGIPVEHFGKTYVKPNSSGYKKNNLYYGTVRIEIPRGTDLRHKIFGWTKAVLKEIEPRALLVERKWEAIRKINRPKNILEQLPPIT